MNQQKVTNPVLRFVYLVCFYATLGFPWNSTSDSIYGVTIAGYMIEPPIFLTFGVVLPLYFFSVSLLQTKAMRQTLLVCRVISVTCGIFLLLSMFLLGGRTAGLSILTTAMVDIKTCFLLWMMPVTLLYVRDNGLERWIWHFFIALACYCVFMLLVRATPYGWGTNFTSKESLFRFTARNDRLLILAIPLAVGWIMDRGFSLFIIIFLGLYLMQLTISQGRTHMGFIAIITAIVVLRSGRALRSATVIFLVIAGIILAIITMPEMQKKSIESRLSNLDEQAEVYITMLHTSNKIAFEAITESPAKVLFGAGFGTILDLYGGADKQKAMRTFVDNLWVTLLLKMGVIGTVFVGGAIIYFCWIGSRGRPLSSIDRVFKWWAFLTPLICLRSSYLLWSSVCGITWATLAVSAMRAEERRFPGLEQISDVDEYDQYTQEDISEEELSAPNIY